MCPRPLFVPLLFVLTSLVLPAAPAAAGECTPSSRPGATLLFPYFEVDLTEDVQRQTLLSIQNTAEQDVLTNVVFWTNCGLPVLSFNLVLRAQEIRPIDIRDLLMSGRLPAGGIEASFPGCPIPVAPAGLDASQLLTIRARLTGQPDPEDGMCYGAALDPASPAVGYVTVDIVNSCSQTIRTPHDKGYFTQDGEQGIAGSANVLWGDVFLVDDQGNQAQGFEAVSLVADAAVAETPGLGFYKNGNRRPLASHYRTRFFQGGSFDGGTEVLVWMASTGYSYPFECEHSRYSACGLGGFSSYVTDIVARRESGEEVLVDNMDVLVPVSRLKVGGEALPIEARFGSLDFFLHFYSCKGAKCTPPYGAPVQGWVMPIYTAEGRFSAGLRAAAMNDSCVP